MVFSWHINEIVKKKYPATTKDKKDWIAFTKKLGKLYNKDDVSMKENININEVRRLDLHGFSLNKANKIVKKFIIESFADGYKKLLIITGKGSRSKVYADPYVSSELSVLKHSVPEYISKDEDLSNKISKISKADHKDGGEGALYIFLKKRKNFKEWILIDLYL